ncbi:hypothetical protein C5167_009662 [Papaver somniferum]|uniref:Uncharacterized protein n=1 Tax=Papaver somniferum TaxID=3469 RepID=A0A4Y7K162_PAPSO|nr:hypothetical protein C5167_009662 [Papaver somniferum]
MSVPYYQLLNNSNCAQVKASDTPAYYSCDDHFAMVDKAVDCNQGDRSSGSQSDGVTGQGNRLDEASNARAIATKDEKDESKSFRSFVRLLMGFVAKLLTIFHVIRCGFGLRHLENVSHSNKPKPSPDNRPPATAEVIKEEHPLLPCLQRLKRLETIYGELSTKPAEIPPEKDQILMDSLDRIKSVEFDLEKTKRELHATVVKQLEITEFLENLRESNFRGIFYGKEESYSVEILKVAMASDVLLQIVRGICLTLTIVTRQPCHSFLYDNRKRFLGEVGYFSFPQALFAFSVNVFGNNQFIIHSLVQHREDREQCIAFRSKNNASAWS